MIVHDFKFDSKSLWHFAPVVFLSIYCTPEYDPIWPLDHVSLMRLFWIMYVLPYLVFIHLLLKKHAAHLVSTYRKTRMLSWAMLVKLDVYVWIRTLYIACVLYWILNVLFLLIPGLREFSVFLTFLATALIYFLGLLGILKSGVFLRSNILSDKSE
jgi:hypothetical protein